jgi:hypothetical protein
MNQTRGKTDLVDHHIFNVDGQNFGNLPPINNIIIKVDDPDDKWLEETMHLLGGWRGTLRSTYIRWALAINGLDVAADRYADNAWSSRNRFVVHSINNAGQQVEIASWDGQTASESHRKTMPMLAAFGVMDLFGALEEVIFQMYRTYLIANPSSIVREFPDLKKLRREAQEDESKRGEWDQAICQRMDEWQRKKLYSGLDKVFLAYFKQARLTPPPSAINDTPKVWSSIIGGIALLRNCLTHGAKSVPIELAEFSQESYSAAFDFKEGEPIVVRLEHLQSVQMLFEQFLNSLNMALVRRVS